MSCVPSAAGNVFGPVSAHIPALAGISSHRTKPARYTYAFDQDPDISSWWLDLERALKGNALLNLAEVPNAAICHGAANLMPEFGQVLTFLSMVLPKVAFAVTLRDGDIEDVCFVLGEDNNGPNVVLVTRRKASVHPNVIILIEVKRTFRSTIAQLWFDEQPCKKIYDMVEMYGQAYLEAAYPLGEETQRNSEFGPLAKEVLEVCQRALDLDGQRTSDILKGKANLLPLEDVDAAYDKYDEVSKRYQEKINAIFENYMRARRAMPPFRVNRVTLPTQETPAKMPRPITPPDYG
ncbi:hypothetical protein GGF46_002104 [Coemansia sp. RSA 552]|nr:hypothetical protein GGF46_002104 [Coemansia sp. RSA 552]